MEKLLRVAARYVSLSSPSNSPKSVSIRRASRAAPTLPRSIAVRRRRIRRKRMYPNGTWGQGDGPASTPRRSWLGNRRFGKHDLALVCGAVEQGGAHAHYGLARAEAHLYRREAGGVRCQEVGRDLWVDRGVAIEQDVPLDQRTCLRAAIISQHAHAERLRKDREHRVDLSVTCHHFDRAERCW